MAYGKMFEMQKQGSVEGAAMHEKIHAQLTE